MEIDDEELLWQAMQDDNNPRPPSPPEEPGIHLPGLLVTARKVLASAGFSEEDRCPEDHFLPPVSIAAEPRREHDLPVPPAGPSESLENSLPDWLAKPLRPPGAYAPESAREPARDKRWSSLAEEVNQVNYPRRRAGEIEGTCMSITGPCGSRVYAKTSAGVDEPRKCKIVRTSEAGLLSTSIDILLEQAEEDTVEQIRTAAKSHPLSGETDAAIQKSQDELWVDKYAPKLFTELSSDERVNREVVRWLKEWDPCVFGRKLPPGFHNNKSGLQQSYKKQMVRGRQSRPPSAYGAGRFDKNFKNWERKDHAHGEPVDTVPSDRPAEKVLLLSGPPGLGKTTLAHVAAKHCGYHVVEVNGSDDRTAATLQTKIMNAIEMRSVMGDGRPNCLIIDEIDGSLGGPEGRGAIDALLKLISADAKPLEDEVQQTNLKRRPKRKGGHMVKLLRPVICICNDLYAPALRNLRTVARVCTFLPPSCARIATRLKQVCSSEGYHATAGALTVLAEQTECDIRLCLHTLQFLHSKTKSLDTSTLPSQVIGSKNTMHNISAMWREVFQCGAKHRRAPKQTSTHDGGSGGTDDMEFHRLYDILSNNADIDMSDKVHDNVLQMRLSDSSLQKLVDCLKIIGDTDIMARTTTSRQQYYLNAYQPANFLALRRLVSKQDTPQLNCPTVSQRLRSDLKVKKEMLRDWQSSMSVGARRGYSLDNLSEDLISPLLSALAPRGLRPVALQMLTSEEKRGVKNLITCMLTYGVTYKESTGAASANGLDNSRFVLEPPLHSLIMFQNHVSRYFPLSASMQQMLSHEADMERIRLQAARAVSGKPPRLKQNEQLAEQDGLHSRQSTLDSETSVIQSSEAPARPFVNEEGAKMSTGLLPATMKKSQKRPAHDITGFFARLPPKDGESGKVAVRATSSQRKVHPVTFKYQEGFTSAVKRPMFVRDFRM